MTLINRIKLDDAKRAIFGDADWHRLSSEQLDTFAEHLGTTFRYAPDHSASPARFASSLITRSEAELLGLSPRFAVRLYLADGGFINCRRLPTLIQSFEYDGCSEWGKRNPKKPHPHPDIPKGVDSALNKTGSPRRLQDFIDHGGSVCIADCLLAAPQALKKAGYTFLTCDLFAAYGEVTPPRDAGPFTPYSRSFNLGGGWCAQAVSFVATALLAQHASRVCGPAEITALAHAPELGEITITGMDAEEMARYFDRVNLRLTKQISRLAPGPCSEATLATAVRSYIRSGMPVVFPTDMFALGTDEVHPDGTVYRRNGIHYDPNELYRRGNLPHAVLIVGCHENGHDFVFHDPGVLPYLEINAAELATLGAPAEGQRLKRDAGVIMPLTPKAVRLPFLPGVSLPTRRPHGGLLSLVAVLRQFLNDIEGDAASSPNWISRVRQKVGPAINGPLFEQKFASFLLMRGSVASTDLHPIDLESQVAFANVLRVHLHMTGHEDRWHWLQLHRNHLHIWDAELEPPDNKLSLQPNDIAHYLRATIYLDGKIPTVFPIG